MPYKVLYQFIIESLGTEFHAYTDDTQIYTTLMTDIEPVSRGCRNAPSHYSIGFGKKTSCSTLTSLTWLSTEWGQVWRDPICRLRYPCIQETEDTERHVQHTIVRWSYHQCCQSMQFSQACPVPHLLQHLTRHRKYHSMQHHRYQVLLFDVPAKTVSCL